MNKATILFGGATFVVLLDQLTKWIVTQFISLGETVTVIPSFLHLTYVRNVGAGFGILQEQRLFLIIISLAVISFILFSYKKIPPVRYVHWSLAGILGGAIGNLIGRIFRGYVVDFIHIGWWPKFNIADTCIVLGGIGLAYYFWKEEK